MRLLLRTFICFLLVLLAGRSVATTDLLVHAETNDSLTQAWLALTGTASRHYSFGSSTTEGRTHARDFAQRVLALDYSNAEAHLILGFIFHEEKDFRLAIDEYKLSLNSVTTKPASEDWKGIHVFIGLALEALGEIDQAILEYRTAVRFKPNDASLHKWIGNALKQKGDLKEAISEYRAASRILPNDADVYMSLGQCLLESDQLNIDLAIDDYRHAIRLRPDDHEFHMAMGSALLTKGDKVGAISEYYEAARIKPQKASQIHWQLGFILQAKGDLSLAILEFQKSLEIDPSSETVAMDLVVAKVDSGNWQGGYAKFHEMKRHTGLGEPWILYHFANLLSQRGRQTAAIRAYEEVVKMTEETQFLFAAARKKLADLQ